MNIDFEAVMASAENRCDAAASEFTETFIALVMTNATEEWRQHMIDLLRAALPGAWKDGYLSGVMQALVCVKESLASGEEPK